MVTNGCENYGIFSIWHLGIWAFPGVLLGSLMSGVFLYGSWNGNLSMGQWVL
jgi:hypothetical protein